MLPLYKSFFYLVNMIALHLVLPIMVKDEVLSQLADGFIPKTSGMETIYWNYATNSPNEDKVEDHS